MPTVSKSGSLNLLEPSGPVTGRYRDSLCVGGLPINSTSHEVVWRVCKQHIRGAKLTVCLQYHGGFDVRVYGVHIVDKSFRYKKRKARQPNFKSIHIPMPPLCFHQANKKDFFPKAGMKRMARTGRQGIPWWHLKFNNTVFPGTLHTGTTFTLPSA